MSDNPLGIASALRAAFNTPRRRAAIPFVLHGISAGLSGNAILGHLVSGGMGIRRQEGLRAIRLLRSVATPPPGTPRVGLGEVPEAELFKWSAFPTRRLFTYHAQVVGEHPVTGQIVSEWVSISSDVALSNDAIWQRIQTISLTSDTSLQFKPTTYGLEKITISNLWNM